MSTESTPTAETGEGHIDTAVSHACLSNFIVFTEDPEDEALINETIPQYVIKHPCRVILILAKPRSSESKLEQSIHSHNYRGISGRSATCDQITLRASGGGVKETASAVQSLLVPDLPINLWWRGIFLNQMPLVDQMLTFADRFIYDGTHWTNLHYTVRQVADCVERYQNKVGFTNFNWARLRPWRDCTADFFDLGLFPDDVWNINRVRIEFMSLPGNEEGFQYRALLYLAWLAVQLEWTPVRGMPGIDQAQIEFTNKAGATVDTELILVPQNNGAGQSLQKVVLGVHTSSRMQEFIVEREHRDRLMILSCRDEKGTTELRKVPHSDSTVADLLYRELGRRVRNRVFERTFKMAANLLQMV